MQKRLNAAISTSGPNHPAENPTVFDGFPYLVTQVVGAFYHIILLPAEFSAGTLHEVGLYQFRANRLPTCIVTSPTNCAYYSADGGQVLATSIPRGGRFVTDRLRPWIDFLESQELLRRKRLLAEFIEDRNRGARYLLGDLTKGGRAATANELIRLSGRQRNGIPQGLEQCLQCGDWRGECLDPNPEFAGLVMRACCRCENDNRCARCHGLLYEYKLNANYFDPADGKIWHVAGFSGLSHRCPEVIPCSRA